MNNFKRTILMLCLMLSGAFFGAKAFGQEWENIIPYHKTDSVMTRQYCAYEMSDGRIIVSASFIYNIGSYIAGYPFYPPHNALVALSPDGEELAQNNYFRPGYWGSSYNPYVFENEKGEVFMLTTYSPDHESRYFNYFKNYDNPPTDAILGLYKLDDDLGIVEAFEYSFPVDTIQGQDEYSPCESSGGIHLHSAIYDEGCIVGAYTKNVSYDRDSIHGYDSLFFFRMNLEGELLANVGYEIPYSGWEWQLLFWREQLAKTDFGYIYYANRSGFVPSNGEKTSKGRAIYVDNDFNLLKTRPFQHPGNPGAGADSFEDVSVKRSKHNTTYFATRSSQSYSQTKDDCLLYELDDNIEGMEEQIPVIREIQRKTQNFDCVAESRAVEVGNDNSIFFCYSLNCGYQDSDSWTIVERLDEDFNTLMEVYYGNGSDMIWTCAESITLTSENDILMTVWLRNLNDREEWGSTVVKFPAEAFVGIDEAHDNGLKVAIAYPNPGKDVLNIRTGLKDARVEVYDMNGRLVHSQALTENVTAIDAGDWAEGFYVWKVYTTGVSTGSTTLVETGKWIKE